MTQKSKNTDQDSKKPLSLLGQRAPAFLQRLRDAGHTVTEAQATEPSTTREYQVRFPQNRASKKTK